MKTKQEIVENWLPRYTGMPLESFGRYILLTNFDNYVRKFAEWNDVEVKGEDRAMLSTTAQGITIINFGMGSPNAATIIDCLSAIKPEACLFLGKCGGLKKKHDLGHFILPIAGIRGEGTSNDYFRRRCRHFLPLHFKRRSPPPSATTTRTTGQARCIQPTGVYGNGMNISRNTLSNTGRMAIDMETATIFLRPLFTTETPGRSAAAGFRPTHDPRRNKDGNKRSRRDVEFRGPSP